MDGETEGLSEQQGIDLLMGRNTPAPEDGAAEAEIDNQGDPDQIDDQEIDDAASEGEPQIEAEQELASPEDDPDADYQDGNDTDAGHPAIEPPDSWTAKAKDGFRALNRDAQQEIARNEHSRTQNIRMAQDEVAQQRKDFEAREANVNKLRDQYAEQLKRTVQVSEPVPPDPALLDVNSETYDTDLYHRLDAQYRHAVITNDKYKAELLEIQKAQHSEEQIEIKKWQQETVEYCAKHIPDLTDPDKGQALANAILDYAINTRGLSRQDVEQANGPELGILHDAYRYHELTKKSKGTGKRLKRVPKTVKPGGGDVPVKLSTLDDKVKRGAPLTHAEGLEALKRRSAKRK